MNEITDFTRLFKNDTALIDTRSPIEFEQGSFPCAKNLPLMNTKERELVGTCYKQKGQVKAIKLGNKLVSGERKNNRIEAWIEFIKKHPNGALYCFRGGLRSQISQKWISDNNFNYPYIKGGYKALRRFLIDETVRIMGNITPIVIGGRTGCGKTIFLKQMQNKIDLEYLANHRGSAFGNTATNQPTQINFENNLAIDLIKKQKHKYLLFEDEGRNIGVINIPSSVREKTNTSDLILLKAGVQERLEITTNTYAKNMFFDFYNQNQLNAIEMFSNYWHISLKKIQKRLGLERYKKIQKRLDSALKELQNQNSFNGFYSIVETLLFDYYDPMYDYQIKNKKNRIIFQGNSGEILDFINTL